MWQSEMQPHKNARRVQTVDGACHVVSLDPRGCWRVIPAMSEQGLTAEAADEYSRDLRDAARLARHMNDVERRRRLQPINAAISDEVREIIASHEWTPSEAAAAFDMAAPTLSAKLEHRMQWSITDLAKIGEAVNPSSPGDVVMFLYQAATGAPVASSLDPALQST